MTSHAKRSRSGCVGITVASTFFAWSRIAFTAQAEAGSFAPRSSAAPVLPLPAPRIAVVPVGLLRPVLLVLSAAVLAVPAAVLAVRRRDLLLVEGLAGHVLQELHVLELVVARGARVDVVDVRAVDLLL